MEDKVLNTTLNGKSFKIHIRYENKPSEKTIENFAQKLVELAYDKNFIDEIEKISY